MKAMCWIVPPRAIPASPAANNHTMGGGGQTVKKWEGASQLRITGDDRTYLSTAISRISTARGRSPAGRWRYLDTRTS